MNIKNLFITFMSLVLFTLVFTSCNGESETHSTDSVIVVDGVCSLECNEGEVCECTITDEKSGCKCVKKSEAICDPACGENEECKCEEVSGKVTCECKEKDVVETKSAPACDPVCTSEQNCVCENDKCECKEKPVDITPTEPSCGTSCETPNECVCIHEDDVYLCTCKKPDNSEDHKCLCDDGTECPEGDKDKCVADEEEHPVLMCEEECSDGKVCNCNKDSCKCENEVTVEEPTCDPVCEENHECVCNEEGCTCREKESSEEHDVQPNVKCEVECDEAHECRCEDEVCQCVEKENTDPKPDGPTAPVHEE